MLVLAAAALLLSASQQRAGAAVKSYIVELAADPVVVAKARAEAAGREFDEAAYRRQVVAGQDEFLARLSAAGVPFRVVSVDAPNGPNGEVSNIEFRFNYVYNGVTLEVAEAAVPIIEAMSGVKAVHPNGEIFTHLDHGVKYTRAPALYGNPPKVRMGDELQREGYHGEGIYIAVLDTGVEWQHPMFGGDPTPPRFGVGPAVAAVNHNQKVPYYLNLTAGAVTDDFGHGSHVAGIAAGYLAKAPGEDGLPMTADDVSIHGVAPQAKIMGYKVLSTIGSGAEASIIMGVEDAVQPFTLAGYPKPVAHVINLSLGDASNNPNAPTARACDNATLAGVTVVASAGNSGRPTATNATGEGTIGSPGTGRRVLTVGASEDPGSAPNKIDEVGGGNRTGMKGFPLQGGAPITRDISANYVYCGLADTPDQVPDSVAGKIALIQRGSTVNVEAAATGTGLFSNKAALAAAKGAVAVVIYNNVDGELTAATTRKAIVPVVGLSKANGEYLKKAIGSTAFGAVSPNQIRINRALVTEMDMADFSSKGAVSGFGMIKPDVTAPGVSVLSATVRVGGVDRNQSSMFDPTGYISTSGTSMSSPMTAGVAALVKQKNPSWTPSMVRAAIMNTATNLVRVDGTAVPDGTQSLNQQGAGHVDAFAAANAKALMGVGAVTETGGTPTARTHGVLASASPGNPDFLGSHSFGAVPIAGVEGTATHTQTVNIFDIRDGAGAGTYELSVSNVKGVDGDNAQVSLTDASGRPAASVEVAPGGGASFNVVIRVNGKNVADVTQIQWYVTANRADGGQRLRMPFYYRAVKPTVAAVAPTFSAVTGTEVAGNPPVDVNGTYRLQFAKPATGAQASHLRVQESSDGGATWATLGDVPASQTAFDVAGRGNGTFQYRVLALYPVQYGVTAGPASAARPVRVDRRLEADVSSLVELVNQSIVFGAGTTDLTSFLRNTSAGTTVYAPATLQITSISSRSGHVRVTNADSGGDGRSSAAGFDYTALLAGGDLAPGESSGTRAIRFANPNTELFTFTAVIRAHLPDPAYAGGTPAGATAASGSNGGEGDGGTSAGSEGASAGSVLDGGQAVLKFTVNPLTRTISLVQ
jgi:subtilisin family serine protease